MEWTVLRYEEELPLNIKEIFAISDQENARFQASLFFHSAKQFKVPHNDIWVVYYIIFKWQSLKHLLMTFFQEATAASNGVHSSVDTWNGFSPSLTVLATSFQKPLPLVWIAHHKKLLAGVKGANQFSTEKYALS